MAMIHPYLVSIPAYGRVFTKQVEICCAGEEVMAVQVKANPGILELLKYHLA